MLLLKPVIVVMTKIPVPGKTKSRLASILTPDQRGELSQAFLQDIISELRILPYELAIAIWPPGNEDIIEEILEYPYMIFPQRGNDIGERMMYAAQDMLYKGLGPVIIVGSDIPLLSGYHIKKAIEALQNNDIVLGPAKDGGFYLIGLNTCIPNLFHHINWSSGQECQQLINNTKKLSLKLHLIDELFDIDTPDDYHMLYQEIRERVVTQKPYPTSTWQVLSKYKA